MCWPLTELEQCRNLNAEYVIVIASTEQSFCQRLFSLPKYATDSSAQESFPKEVIHYIFYGLLVQKYILQVNLQPVFSLVNDTPQLLSFYQLSWIQGFASLVFSQITCIFQQKWTFKLNCVPLSFLLLKESAFGIYSVLQAKQFLSCREVLGGSRRWSFCHALKDAPAVLECHSGSRTGCSQEECEVGFVHQPELGWNLLPSLLRCAMQKSGSANNSTSLKVSMAVPCSSDQHWGALVDPG